MGINGRNVPDQTFPALEQSLALHGSLAVALADTMPRLMQPVIVGLAEVAKPKLTMLADVATASVGFSLADFVSKTVPPQPVVTPSSVLMEQLTATTAPLSQHLAQSLAQCSPLADILAMVTESVATRVSPLSAEPVGPPTRQPARLSAELTQLRQWLDTAPWPYVVAFCLLLWAWVAAAVDGEGPTSPEQLTRLAGAVLAIGSVQRHGRGAFPINAGRGAKLVDNIT